MVKAIDIIRQRKKLWHRDRDIQKDIEFRDSVADMLVSNKGKDIRGELFDNPELLIELFFVIVDKEQETVPYFFNDVQKKFLAILNQDIKDYKAKKRNHLKYLVLKGRQQGFTSLISALQLSYAICRPNFSGYTLADNSNNSHDIFTDKGKFYFDNLPKLMQPDTRLDNRREFDFNKKDSNGLNSKWRVDTAGNKEAGRSKTISFMHGSECAFWDNSKTVLTGLTQAFTRNCIVILESTANGFNYYKELWDADNNYENLFFEWWQTYEYRLNFESGSIRNNFLKRINLADDKECEDCETESWVFSRLKWLKYVKGLDDNQLYWYYGKWKDIGEDIKQEYPCSDDEAFLASGRNFFPVGEVMKRIDFLSKKKPFRKGYFTYSFTSSPVTGEKLIKDDSIKFVDDSNGYISIFIEPDNFERFVVSADTAGDGSDFNAAHVLNPLGVEYAVIHLINDEDLYADQLYCMGMYFNGALIAVESNFSTYVNKTLQNREYPVIYTRVTSPDNISQTTVEKLGFNTNKATRPVLLGKLKELVREHIDYINDIDTLNEMTTFVVNEKGKPEAMEGYHDDLIMSYGIGLYCLEQIPPEEVIRVVIPDGFWTREELEDMGYPNYLIRDYLARRGL